MLAAVNGSTVTGSVSLLRNTPVNWIAQIGRDFLVQLNAADVLQIQVLSSDSSVDLFSPAGGASAAITIVRIQ